jgi:hypothetical protein
VSGAINARPTLGARIGRLIEIVLIFVVLGPSIGFLVCLPLLVVSAGNLSSTLFAVQFFMPLSYIYGAAPATLAGAAIGITQAFFGRTRWPMALAVGLIAGGVFLKSVDAFNPGAAFQAQIFDGFAVPLFPALAMLTCLVPTLVCWRLVRRPYFAPSSCMGATP